MAATIISTNSASPRHRQGGAAAQDQAVTVAIDGMVEKPFEIAIDDLDPADAARGSGSIAIVASKPGR